MVSCSDCIHAYVYCKFICILKYPTCNTNSNAMSKAIIYIHIFKCNILT